MKWSKYLPIVFAAACCVGCGLDAMRLVAIPDVESADGTMHRGSSLAEAIELWGVEEFPARLDVTVRLYSIGNHLENEKSLETVGIEVWSGEHCTEISGPECSDGVCRATYELSEAGHCVLRFDGISSAGEPFENCYGLGAGESAPHDETIDCNKTTASYD